MLIAEGTKRWHRERMLLVCMTGHRDSLFTPRELAFYLKRHTCILNLADHTIYMLAFTGKRNFDGSDSEKTILNVY